MIGSAVSGVLNGFFSLFLMMIALLPEVDFESLPLAPPGAVTGVLSFLNVFIPIKDLLVILGVWVGAIILMNVVAILSSMVDRIK